jgi:HNH endonuclease
MKRGRRIQRICNGCRADFFPTVSQIKEGKGLFCSNPCARRYDARLRRQAVLAIHPLPEAPPGVAYIPLNAPGKFVVVDEEDYERLSGHNWVISRTRGREYVFRYLPRSPGSRQRIVFMHREILGLPPPRRGELITDHADGNGLNNRRSNLRACTDAENSRNQRTQRRAKSSRFKGVHFWKLRGVWCAAITCNGRRRCLGNYQSETEAALAYDRAAIEYFGVFARLNFPKPGGAPC